ncbi:MAG: TetR family transcriptional regulator [Acidimicrobiia bacterium]
MDESDARTRLREAALDLFGRQGVAATSTREILKAAGCGTRRRSRTT